MSGGAHLVNSLLMCSTRYVLKCPVQHVKVFFLSKLQLKNQFFFFGLVFGDCFHSTYHDFLIIYEVEFVCSQSLDNCCFHVCLSLPTG